MEDGGADVTREGIWLEWWWWGMVLGGDRLGVEFVDNVDVKVVDGGNRVVEVVARATAVRNWSESAAHWAVWLWPVEVGVVFCECLLQDIAML